MENKYINHFAKSILNNNNYRQDFGISYHTNNYHLTTDIYKLDYISKIHFSVTIIINSDLYKTKYQKYIERFSLPFPTDIKETIISFLSNNKYIFIDFTLNVPLGFPMYLESKFIYNFHVTNLSTECNMISYFMNMTKSYNQVLQYNKFHPTQLRLDKSILNFITTILKIDDILSSNN